MRRCDADDLCSRDVLRLDHDAVEEAAQVVIGQEAFAVKRDDGAALDGPDVRHQPVDMRSAVVFVVLTDGTVLLRVVRDAHGQVGRDPGRSGAGDFARVVKHRVDDDGRGLEVRARLVGQRRVQTDLDQRPRIRYLGEVHAHVLVIRIAKTALQPGPGEEVFPGDGDLRAARIGAVRRVERQH